MGEWPETLTLDELKERLVIAAGGQSLNAARETHTCVWCGSSKMQPGDFDDELSRAEARITQTCQVCQDEIFSDYEPELH